MGAILPIFTESPTMPSKDFDISGLAAYLHLTPQQVERLANRGKVPGRRVGGEWRFSQAEIHHWMETRMGVLDDGELAHVEDVLEDASDADQKKTISVAGKLPLEAIDLALPARTRGKVITTMATLAAKSGLLWDPGAMADAVRAREDMQPTALENGVALLHPRRPMPAILEEPFLALGRVDGGVPFGGARGALTDIFFLICSSDDSRHLRVLARLARLISDGTLLSEIRQATDPVQLKQQIVQREEELLA
jgi:PTS system nitrogen regulatory IIA component